MHEIQFTSISGGIFLNAQHFIKWEDGAITIIPSQKYSPGFIATCQLDDLGCDCGNEKQFGSLKHVTKRLVV